MKKLHISSYICLVLLFHEVGWLIYKQELFHVFRTLLISFFAFIIAFDYFYNSVRTTAKINIELTQELIKNYINNVNNKGCGYFAYYFYKHHQYKFDQIKLIAYNIKDSDIHKCKSCDHFMLNVFNKEESIGFDGLNKQPIFFQDDTYKFYPFTNLEVALKKSSWNTAFDKKQLPLLEYIIEYTFKHRTIFYFFKLYYLKLNT